MSVCVASQATAASLLGVSCGSSEPMRLAYGDGGGIVVVDTAGKLVQRLTRPPGDWSDGDPSWSPDGKSVAFDRFYTPNTGGVELYLVSASGGKARMLTYGFSPSWSPRGSSLLVTRTNGHDFWPAIIDADRPRREVDLPRAGVWSPDGRITLADGGDLVIADALGAHGRRVWSGQADDPAWSPDGTRIAFVARSGRRDQSTALWVVHSDGSAPTLIIHAMSLGAPTWSPDGRRIAFSAARGDRGTIEIVDPDGRHDEVVERNGGVDPTWSPDGEWLAYAAPSRGFTAPVYLVRPDGSGLRRLPRVYAEAPSLAWRPCTP